jgi:CubicO group peptidase (beta-lactamase class C family)
MGWAFGDTPEAAALDAVAYAGKWSRCGRVKDTVEVCLQPDEGSRALQYAFIAVPNGQAHAPDLERLARPCAVVEIGPAGDQADEYTGLRGTLRDWAKDGETERRIVLDDGRELHVELRRLMPVVLPFAP